MVVVWFSSCVCVVGVDLPPARLLGDVQVLRDPGSPHQRGRAGRAGAIGGDVRGAAVGGAPGAQRGMHNGSTCLFTLVMIYTIAQSVCNRWI